LGCLHRAAVRLFCRWIAVALVVGPTFGCGGTEERLTPLYGTISLDGRPLANGLVQFVPEEPASRTSVASVSAGCFTAMTGGRAGVVPGRYRIRVEARAEPVDETDTLPRSLLPERYSDAAQSGLSCEVIAGRPHTIDLQLESGT